MGSELKVITFLSGRGSNFQGLLNASRDPSLSGKYSIIAVVSDKPGASGLYYAKEAGIPVHAFFRSDFPSLEDFKKKIFETAQSLNPDLITLAGYMQLVPAWYIEQNIGKIINVHPSLLPAYPGLNTHARVLADRTTEHGCTVHFVDTGIDTGPTIAQCRVPVDPHDTPDTLAAKVLLKEHQLYPWVVSAIARKLIQLTNGVVEIESEARKEAHALDFIV